LDGAYDLVFVAGTPWFGGLHWVLAASVVIVVRIPSRGIELRDDPVTDVVPDGDGKPDGNSDADQYANGYGDADQHTDSNAATDRDGHGHPGCSGMVRSEKPSRATRHLGRL